MQQWYSHLPDTSSLLSITQPKDNAVSPSIYGNNDLAKLNF